MVRTTGFRMAEQGCQGWIIQTAIFKMTTKTAASGRGRAGEEEGTDTEQGAANEPPSHPRPCPQGQVERVWPRAEDRFHQDADDEDPQRDRTRHPCAELHRCELFKKKILP